MGLFKKNIQKKEEEKKSIEKSTSVTDNTINLLIDNAANSLKKIGYGRQSIDDFVTKSFKCIGKSKSKGKTDDTIRKYIELDFNRRKNIYINDSRKKDLLVDKINENVNNEALEPLMRILTDKNYVYLRSIIEIEIVNLDFNEHHGQPFDLNRRLNLFIQALETLGYGESFIKQFESKIKKIISKEKDSSFDDIVNIMSSEYSKAKKRNFSLANAYLEYLKEQLENVDELDKVQMKNVIMDEIRYMLSLTDTELKKYYEKKDSLANVEIGTHESYFTKLSEKNETY